MASKIELVQLKETEYVPNSAFPVVIYRDVLPFPDDEDAVRQLLEGNGFRVDGLFGPFSLKHYHSNTHECYAFVAGSSTILLGQGEHAQDSPGTEVQVTKGDVLLIPAGTAHSNKVSSDDFKYAASYPTGSPHWDVCKGIEDDETIEVFRANARSVVAPESDPIFGRGGPLKSLWK